MYCGDKQGRKIIAQRQWLGDGVDTLTHRARSEQAQRGQLLQGIAQARQIARTRGFERDPRGDALHIHKGAQHRVDTLMAAAGHQLSDRGMTGAQQSAVSQGMMQRMAQQAAAHRRGALVE